MEANHSQWLLGHPISRFRLTRLISSIVRGHIQTESSRRRLQTDRLSFGECIVTLSGNRFGGESGPTIVADRIGTGHCRCPICRPSNTYGSGGRHCWTCRFGRLQFLSVDISNVLQAHRMALPEQFAMLVDAGRHDCIGRCRRALQRNGNQCIGVLCIVRFNQSLQWIPRQSEYERKKIKIKTSKRKLWEYFRYLASVHSIILHRFFLISPIFFCCRPFTASHSFNQHNWTGIDDHRSIASFVARTSDSILECR